MMLMAHAGDLIMLFIGLESLSIPLYVMAGFARPEAESEEAALKYFLLGAFASSFVVYGIALVFGATGRRSGCIVAERRRPARPTACCWWAPLLVLVSLGFKVAVVPFHMWTPDVYQGAPTLGDGLHVRRRQGGRLCRAAAGVCGGLPGAGRRIWAPVAVWIAVLTMVWGNVAAVGQANIKRLLAYSSIAHAGYILMAVPAAAVPRSASPAVSAALFYLFAYASPTWARGASSWRSSIAGKRH